ncbi:hypothetical protein T06_4593 [Trichinella sp. T6]|nr:hypothetical protein T06_4593 [Trichinella sp. T6]
MELRETSYWNMLRKSFNLKNRKFIRINKRNFIKLLASSEMLANLCKTDEKTKLNNAINLRPGKHNIKSKHRNKIN